MNNNGAESEENMWVVRLTVYTQMNSYIHGLLNSLRFKEPHVAKYPKPSTDAVILAPIHKRISEILISSSSYNTLLRPHFFFFFHFHKDKSVPEKNEVDHM